MTAGFRSGWHGACPGISSPSNVYRLWNPSQRLVGIGLREIVVALLGKKSTHDDVIKWKHFPRHWPFVQGIHRSPVNSPHKGQWRRALMISLICAWINGWVNNREAGDLRRSRAHYDVIVMNNTKFKLQSLFQQVPTLCMAMGFQTVLPIVDVIYIITYLWKAKSA